MHSRLIIHGPQIGLQQSTKGFRLGELSFVAAVRAANVGKPILWSSAFLFLKLFEQVISAIALVATEALHQRVREHLDVPGGFPDGFREDDGGIQTHHIGAGLHHPPPPLTLDVVFELNTQGTIVPGGARTTIDFTGLEDKAPALG